MEDNVGKMTFPFPQEGIEHWACLDSQGLSLKERVEGVRSVMKLSGLQQSQPEFVARLLDLGIREDVIAILQESWPKLPNRPSLAHRDFFDCP